jgi:hypothetical protein
MFIAGCAAEPAPVATLSPTSTQQPVPPTEPPSTSASPLSSPDPTPAIITPALIPAPAEMEQASDPSIKLLEDSQTGSQSILIESSTTGATIRFTTDSQDPSPDTGTVYQGPVTVDTTTQVKAIAFKDGMVQSEVAQSSFPQADPPSHGSGGRFDCSYELTLGAADEASIRYTTSGEDPTPASSTLYFGPLPIIETSVIKAVAYKDGWINSPTVSIPVNIDNVMTDPPRLDLEGGVYIGPQIVTFSSGGDGSFITYTTDGSDPGFGSGATYQEPITITETTTLKSRNNRQGCQDSGIREDTYHIYGTEVSSQRPIVLNGNETLEIIDTHFVHENDILLSGNATLLIRDSLLIHRKDFAFQYQLKATENSRVIVENSAIGNQCNGSLNWNFHDDATLVASNVSHMQGCNTWHLFAGRSAGIVERWDRFGATTCDKATLAVASSQGLELELCFPTGSVVDETLPTEVNHFSFPNENDSGVDWSLTIDDSSMDGWGIGLPPQSDITIRDSPAVTVSVVVGSPWQNQTVVLEDLASKNYQDRTWNVVDSTLHFLNVTTYGWEPNVFGIGNKLIIRNSDFSGSNLSSGATEVIVENSTMGTMATQDSVKMLVKDSTILGDVIARGDSSLTLENTLVLSQGDEGEKVFGNIFVTDDATITLISSTAEGEVTIQGMGRVIWP